MTLPTHHQHIAKLTEWKQHQTLHHAATTGDTSLFDLEMRHISTAIHGPSLPPAKVLTSLPEDPHLREQRLDKEVLNREMLLALAGAPVVAGLVHPLDSARASISVSRPWPHPTGRTPADEKWMREVMRYYAQWPVMSVEPVEVLEAVGGREVERGDLIPLVQRRRDTLKAVGRGVIDKLSFGKKDGA